MTNWLIFASIIIILLTLDLGVLNKKDKVMGFKDSALLTLFYITIACFFGLFIFYHMGPHKAQEYFTGFLLEKAMSLDNIFVISIIFHFFKIPLQYQHRVLFWGILGVIILRAIMIYAGVLVLAKFSWVLFIFSALLIYTGIKTLYMAENHNFDPQNMYVYQILKKKFNIYPKLAGNKFFIIQDNKLFITPLFIALVTVEFMDLVFAIDSIPAIFAVTTDPYIVYTSNIFAILGLRALFFCLADIVERFKYVKYSLGIILILIGVKIIISHYVKISSILTLAVTVILLILGVVVSVIKKEKNNNG